MFYFARLTCAEGDICACLRLAVVAHAREADVVHLATVQLAQIAAASIGLA